MPWAVIEELFIDILFVEIGMRVASVVAFLTGAAALRCPSPSSRAWPRHAQAHPVATRTAVVRMAVPKGYIVRSLKPTQVRLPSPVRRRLPGVQRGSAG
jgi:hypothetical protein